MKFFIGGTQHRKWKNESRVSDLRPGFREGNEIAEAIRYARPWLSLSSEIPIPVDAKFSIGS